MALTVAARPAGADDLAATAASMTDRAFALLNSLNAQSGGGSANPLLGPIASFASDADTLSHALAKGDTADAADEMTTLKSDRAAVDTALASHAGAIKPDAWNGIKQQLDEISQHLPPATGKTTAAAAPPAASASAGTATITPSASAATASAATASAADASASGVSTATSSDRSVPRVVVDSRVANGDSVRVKGYMEGTALKSAGIYENGRRLQAFKVNDVPGQQKIDFDIGLAHPSPDTVIRVTDVEGRFAEAPVLDVSTTASEPGPLAPETAGAPDTSDGFGASSEGGVDVFRGAGAAGGSHSDTAEIPSHGAPAPSPSKRHTLGGNLANIRINILGLTQTQTIPPAYHVIGQIAGRGVTHAGIYVNGRLANQIPIDDGADYTSFDQQFEMDGGTATIRAYGVGNQFIESSIDESNEGDLAALPPTMPTAPAASGLAVQITSIQPTAGNLYLVSGAIAGSGLASAGLYQNGVLAQNLNLGGGIGRLIGSLIPGAGRSVNFSARFNPAMGPATIRAFNTNGAYTEQPLVVAGMNPYGSGASPYAGVNPYAASPYGGPVSPYSGMAPTRPPPAPARPLW